MLKLRLNLDELQVDSFVVAGDGTRGSGTVRGHAEQATHGCTAGWYTCALETYNVLCSETHGGFSCDYATCVSCGQEQSCQTEAVCNSFRPCTGDDCVF